MTPVDVDKPIRSPDGRWVFFIESIDEYRGSAISYTIIVFALFAIGILATALSGGSDRANLLDPDFYFGQFGLIMLVPIVLLVLPTWLIWLWKRYHYPTTRLAVGADGIFMPFRAEAPIPWAAIQRISLIEAHHKNSRINVTLSLQVPDRDAYGFVGSQTVRAMWRWSYTTDLAVQLESLVGEPEDVLAVLKEFAPEHLTAGLRLGT